jgi:hypothetical protein
MYPNITLHIESDRNADIRLYKGEGDFRVLSQTTAGLDDILKEVATEIGLDLPVAQLFPLANEGDELVMPFPSPDWEDGDLNHVFITRYAKKVNNDRETYTDVPAEINKQLELNWQSDVLASALASIYNLLIGRTVIFAEDMAIDRVVLDDLSGDPRLAERMASVMQDLERELYLPETDIVEIE